MKNTILIIPIAKLILTIVIIAIIIGLIMKTNTNNIQSYFLEPEGYIIAEINCGEGYRYYGYITTRDYNAYLSGDLKGVLTILYPYKDQSSSISINSNAIVSVKIGEYKDLR